MLAENPLFLGLASNLTSLLCGWSNLTCFQCVDRIWLGFGVGVGKDFDLVLGSKLPLFSYGYRKWLVFVRGRKLTRLLYGSLVLVVGSKLNWFMWEVKLDSSVEIEIYLVLMWGLKRLCFSVGIEISLVLVSRHQNWLDFIVGIEVDSTSVQGSKLTWFLRGGRNVLVCCVETSKWTWFLCGDIEMGLIFEWGSNCIDFSSVVENK